MELNIVSSLNYLRAAKSSRGEVFAYVTLTDRQLKRFNLDRVH